MAESSVGRERRVPRSGVPNAATIVGVSVLDADLMDPRVPERALAAGFSNEPIGTHTGKTMMLAELRLLLGACVGNRRQGSRPAG